MPVRILVFSQPGKPEEVVVDTVLTPADLRLDPEDELLYLVAQNVGWKIDVSRGTFYERTVWSRADTLVRFRRAMYLGATIVFRGRPRPMDAKRAERYERVIRNFDRPPFVIADDVGRFLCLDIGIPSGAS